MPTDRVQLYDTTLRDGSQMEGISFSVEDKIRITRKLDELGLEWIEGGFPGSNPKDAEYFRRLRSVELKNAKVSAFGGTRSTIVIRCYKIWSGRRRPTKPNVRNPMSGIA